MPVFISISSTRQQISELHPAWPNCCELIHNFVQAERRVIVDVNEGQGAETFISGIQKKDATTLCFTWWIKYRDASVLLEKRTIVVLKQIDSEFGHMLFLQCYNTNPICS